MPLKPNVKLGDEVLRRDRSGGETDIWVVCTVNETYLQLINEFPNDFRQLDGERLETLVIRNKPEAVEFAEWLDKTNYAEKETWGRHNDPPSSPLTYSELYELFLKSKIA